MATGPMHLGSVTQQQECRTKDFLHFIVNKKYQTGWGQG